jgi:hypothetical protein
MPLKFTLLIRRILKRAHKHPLGHVGKRGFGCYGGVLREQICPLFLRQYGIVFCSLLHGLFCSLAEEITGFEQGTLLLLSRRQLSSSS